MIGKALGENRINSREDIMSSGSNRKELRNSSCRLFNIECVIQTFPLHVQEYESVFVLSW